MELLKILKSVANKIQSNQKTLFNYNVDMQKKYIEQFDIPVDDIERSFFQYKCQMRMLGFWMEIMLNLSSFFMTIFYLIKLRYKSEESKNVISDAVFLSNGISPRVIPKKLQNEYTDMKYEDDSDVLSLNEKDYGFIKDLIKRYPLSWHFIFKCIVKLSMYSPRIHRNELKAIIVCAEYSFASSVLTAYCDINNIKHINVMHGEKLYYIRDSFFRFHKCYIWDEYYKDLFIELRAEPNQFNISLPESMKFSNVNESEKQIDYTYYLANESEDELYKILKLLRQLTEKNFRVNVRPHPRYSDSNTINHLFNGFMIENSQELTIEESLIRTKNAISLYSTVLNQAYHNGINIIIDDLSNPNHFKKLSELKYINLSRKYTLLSEILKKRDE